MSGKMANSLGLINVNFNPCPYRNLTSMSGSKKVWRLTKQNIVLQVYPNKPIDYNRVRAQTMVMHATINNGLVGGVVLCFLRIILNFKKETTYYQPRWQTWASHKTSLPVRFIKGQARKSNMNSIMLMGFWTFHMGLNYWKITSMINL
jgi:hypothetical protein